MSLDQVSLVSANCPWSIPELTDGLADPLDHDQAVENY